MKIDLVNKICRYIIDTLFGGCMIVTLFVVIQIFFFSSFKIPSNSMEPGLIAGDYVLVNKLIPGARLFNVFVAMRGERVKIVRLPGIRKIKRNDVIVFNYPYPNNLDKIEMHMTKYYIKRCLGLPGDSLSIINGYYKINGVSEPVGNIEGQEIFSVQSNRMLKDAGLYWSFPKDSLISWNVKNLGPLYIPKKGDVIEMNRQNAIIYRKLIEWETGKDLSIENSKNILLNNSQITSYRFLKNYYFVAGDRIEDSQDSRYWGLLPDEFITGKAVLIWKSMDSQTKEIQWNRIFRRID
ncbi:signal peptidase I [Parabacteroides sp.]|uniref:signal peptidase I n=1 Tax=Parabacteroides sp. TaxID=1869337 RepID=UPI0026DF1227|nr:signal peptidase I [Parabacteroides sp.]MDO5427952.1 signal peptidase I [Parabacteroides sp.]